MSFTYYDEKYDYFDHPYNTTRMNERAVELPIAFAFVNGRRGSGLEIGNVLGHYKRVRHRVVDRYEKARNVENCDVFAVGGAFDWIVSISTLEHVRRDEPTKNPAGAAAALVYLRGLLAPKGHMLITVPLGVNERLDDVLMNGAGATRSSTMVRDKDDWLQTPTLEYRPYQLTTKWAESVWIGEWS